jgi:hypothetical protein
MSEHITLECDGPGCEDELVDVDDEEREAKGWFAVVTPDDERPRDFCSMSCLAEWSQLEALLP